MKTEDILKQQRRTGVHASIATPAGWVSSSSKWAESVWKLDSPSARMRDSDCTIIWDEDIPLPVVDGLKVLLWSLLVSRPRDKPLALSNAGRVGQKLKYLGRWMVWRGHSRFDQITSTAVKVFRKDLVEAFSKDEKGKPREIDVDTNTIAGYLLPLQYAHDQAQQMRARGVAPVTVNPFEGSSAWQVASDIVPEIESFTPPLPDEVVLPIVQQAHRWLGTPAKDILRLQAMCIAERDKGQSHLTTTRAIRKKLEAFTFGKCRGEDKPWHPPFAEFLLRYDERPKPTSDFSEEGDERDEDSDREFYGIDLVRRLINNLMAACVTVVRYQSGVRHGEIFSFKPGIDRRTGLPTCVKVEGSDSGAYDMFFVKGVVSKGWDHPTDTKWLLAGRLSGSKELPDAVRALKVLSKLGQPWRDWATDAEAKEALLVQIGHKGLPRDPALVLPLSSENLAELMKDFIEDRVDLSHLDATDERLREYVKSRGRYVQSRQWRKTWANFMIRVDKRLLPAISQQFHHHSVALTEQAYIGKDAMQLGLVESAAMSRAVRYMRRAMEGESHVGGGMRKIAQHDVSDLRKSLVGLSGVERDHEIRQWLLERDVRIWFSPHGKCFIGLLPGESRCHEAAGDPDFTNQVPAFKHRTPKMCSGCPAFAVDEDDLPFWIERYVENKAIWDKAVSRHMEPSYVVAHERWRQSEAVLRSLNVEAESLGPEVLDAALG